VADAAGRKHVDRRSNTRSKRGAVARRVACGPFAVFDSKRMPYKRRSPNMSWYDIPRARTPGLDVEYLMLRGISCGGVSAEQVA